MRITNVIWVQQFVEKIERKHDVTRDEVESLFASQPSVRLVERGNIKGEDLYRAVGQTDEGGYLAVFFVYKKRGRALVISARDAAAKELRAYVNRKK
ncbi:MAG TPA: BrnT family toxin [Pyrinomonadaceae bacterium]|jgi:uncharacterized DUF497 family protein